MSEQIKVGDLVMVMWVHCDQSKLGVIYEVRGFVGGAHRKCGVCGHPTPGPLAIGISGYSGVPVQWLKRIPPIGELERDEIVEEMTA